MSHCLQIFSGLVDFFFKSICDDDMVFNGVSKGSFHSINEDLSMVKRSRKSRW